MRIGSVVVGCLLVAVAATGGAATAAEGELAAPAEAPRWAAGARLRGVVVPNWMLHLFLQQSNPLHSVAVGGELVRTRGDVDLVGSIDYSLIGPDEGNFLGRDKAAGQTDFTQFDGFAFLSTDLTVLWRRPLRDRWVLRYGGGLGVGLVLGDILRTRSDGCSQDTLDSCRPAECAADGDPACSAVELEAGGRHAEPDVPRVLPTVNVQAGLQVRVGERAVISLDGGYRFPALFLGLGGQYEF